MNKKFRVAEDHLAICNGGLRLMGYKGRKAPGYQGWRCAEGVEVPIDHGHKIRLVLSSTWLAKSWPFPLKALSCS